MIIFDEEIIDLLSRFLRGITGNFDTTKLIQIIETDFLEQIANKLFSLQECHFENVRGFAPNTLQMINYNAVCILKNLTESSENSFELF